MKIFKNSLFAIVLFFSVSLFFNSCDNTLELVEEKIETPIVYAMLDYDADFQYVRVERAFASPNTSALILAKNPDSLYYKNAIVKLIRVRNGVSLEKTLEEVDGNDVGYIREDGIFATDPNLLYRISSSDLELKPGDVVKLSVNIGEGDVVTAETKIIEKAIASNPRAGKPVDFSETQPEVIAWNPQTLGGVIHTAEMIIKFTEEQNGVETKKEVVWRFITNTKSESVKLPGGAFYTFMSNNLTKDQSIKRYFDTVDFYVYSGDENFANFILVSQANNGITSSGEIPIYTNLSRGYGLYGSKATTAIIGLGLSVNTLDVLKNSALTKELNFQ